MFSAGFTLSSYLPLLYISFNPAFTGFLRKLFDEQKLDHNKGLSFPKRLFFDISEHLF
jgi:hypothetical protein